MEAEERQQIIDEQQLWLLSLCHYISGAVTISFASLFLLQVAMFGFMFGNPQLFQGANVPAQEVDAMLRFMLPFFGTLTAAGLLFGILEIVSGVFIKKKRYRLFTLSVALPRILMLPYGSVLSIFTLIVLDRDSVKEMSAATVAP